MYNFGEGVVIRIQNLHYTINRNLPWKDKIQGLHHIHTHSHVRFFIRIDFSILYEINAMSAIHGKPSIHINTNTIHIKTSCASNEKL